MPIFDFSCSHCKVVIEFFDIARNVIHRCPSCGKKMARNFPNTMCFVLKYDPKKDKISWGAEGYSRTRRYEEYDKRAKKNRK